MKNTKTKKQGSGRTKGSFSFVKISLDDLNAKFKDTTTPIVVSRKYAEQVGFTNLTSTSAKGTFESIQGTEASQTVAAVVTDLDATEETATS